MQVGRRSAQRWLRPLLGLDSLTLSFLKGVMPMTRQRKLLLALSLVGVGLLLAACGHSSPQSAADPEENPQSATEPTPQVPPDQPIFAPPGTETEIKPIECPQVDLVAVVWERLEKHVTEVSTEEQLRQRLDAIVEQIRKEEETQGGDPTTRCEIIASEAFNKEGFKEGLIDYLVEELRKADKLDFLSKSS